MNGLINVLKPTGMTSHDVVSRIRRIISQKKVGHAGTLDPNAAGVLLICAGKGTKLSDYLMAFDKEYIFHVKLGLLTDTFDIYGKTLHVDEDIKEFPIGEIRSVLDGFLGESYQTPPMYSALKVNGKKLYEYARSNIEIERKKRRICIDRIELLEYSFPYIKVKVKVSKGTYIRTLCYDIGEKLGTCGTMENLVRTFAKTQTIEDAYTLEEIENLHRLGDLSFLQNYDEVLKLDSVMFDDNDIDQLKNGIKVKIRDSSRLNDIFYIKDTQGCILGIGEKSEENLIKIKKRLI
jgi:tRNA pseudouridine55 synthase